MRARSHWQAIDVGILLARQHFVPLAACWLLFGLPLALLVLSLLGRWPALAMVVIWWLKPAFERLPLLWLSRVMFGEVPDVRVLLRSHWRSLPSYLWRHLTARLAPMRSLDAAVDVLERPSTLRERRTRLGLLHRGAAAGTWLTVVGAHVEAAIGLSVLMLGLWLTPDLRVERIDVEAGFLDVFIGEVRTLDVVLNFTIAALVAPFYVSAGFCLYLNRRCELEAWDLQLGFGRLADRLRQRDAGRRATTASVSGMVAVAVLVALVAVVPAPLHAVSPSPMSSSPTAASATSVLAVADGSNDAERAVVGPADAEAVSAPPAERGVAPPTADRASARGLIADVMAGPDFHNEVTSWSLDFPWEASRDTDAGGVEWLGKFLVRLVSGLAEVAYWLAWVVAIVVAVLVGWHYRFWVQAAAAGATWKPSSATRRRIVVSDPESQPAETNAVAVARQLWQAGDAREALSALYRGALVAMVSRHGIALRDSDTEDECVRLAAGVPEHGPMFAEVARAWQAMAYAHRAPAGATFERLAGWLQAQAA